MYVLLHRGAAILRGQPVRASILVNANVSNRRQKFLSLRVLFRIKFIYDKIFLTLELPNLSK